MRRDVRGGLAAAVEGGGAASVLGFELRDAVFEVADVFDAGLRYKLVVVLAVGILTTVIEVINDK